MKERQGCNTHYQFIEDRKKRDKERLRIKGMNQNIKSIQNRRQKYAKANSNSQHFWLKLCTIHACYQIQHFRGKKLTDSLKIFTGG